jgi:hypothetical protein
MKPGNGACRPSDIGARIGRIPCKFSSARPKTKPKFFMAFAKSRHWEYMTVIEA